MDKIDIPEEGRHWPSISVFHHQDLKSETERDEESFTPEAKDEFSLMKKMIKKEEQKKDLNPYNMVIVPKSYLKSDETLKKFNKCNLHSRNEIKNSVKFSTSIFRLNIRYSYF